jgi:hypothetical protein
VGYIFILLLLPLQMPKFILIILLFKKKKSILFLGCEKNFILKSLTHLSVNIVQMNIPVTVSDGGVGWLRSQPSFGTSCFLRGGPCRLRPSAPCPSGRPFLYYLTYLNL